MSSSIRRYPGARRSRAQTEASWILPSRKKLIGVSQPIRSEPSDLKRSSMPAILELPSDSSMSPSRNPACAAGPSHLARRSAPHAGPFRILWPDAWARQLSAPRCHISTADASVPDDLANEEESSAAGNRKADALCAVDQGGVDTHHLAGRHHERPARAARIERGIRLDDVLDKSPAAGPQRPPK